ncbi:hypothetical protein Scep_020407 [Stephania cephalantha]|uniref:Uncharacterized protein n=1 Tax=Stephania cephalantha TaxID=152367 RepID=A0AAP0ICM7_9MAGN
MYVNPMELAPIYIASTTNAVVKALQLEASKPNKTTNSKVESFPAGSTILPTQYHIERAATVKDKWPGALSCWYFKTK